MSCFWNVARAYCIAAGEMEKLDVACIAQTVRGWREVLMLLSCNPPSFLCNVACACPLQSGGFRVGVIRVLEHLHQVPVSVPSHRQQSHYHSQVQPLLGHRRTQARQLFAATPPVRRWQVHMFPSRCAGRARASPMSVVIECRSSDNEN